MYPDKQSPEALMDHRDSRIRLEQEQAYAQKVRAEKAARKQSLMESRSKHEGFHNHPDDPDNPNKVREKYLRTIRSLQRH
jgi:hypothetical protein